MPGPPHDDDVELWRQTSRLSNQLGLALDKHLVARHGIGTSEMLALMAVSEGPERGIRIQELAETIGLNQSSTSRLAVRLQAKGLAERVSCDYDRRGVYCALTDDGRALLDEACGPLAVELTRALDAAAFDRRSAATVSRLRYRPSKPGVPT